ncbi:MAG: hypothetical protein FJ320_00155 [SAR202 cluster bacterium]|nr:hypothetical protein [SAR202 cluster bacterium]
MNVFFDVDQTILGMDNSLRPGTRETMVGLIDGGHRVYVWSGVGVRKEAVRRHKLEELVSGVYHKPQYDHVKRLTEMGVLAAPDFVVDDDPEVVGAFGGLWVPPYYASTTGDREMERVLKAAMEFAAKGVCDDPQFRARRG